MDGNMNRAVQGIEAEWPDEAARLAAERRADRTDAALQAGWTIRFDPVRLQYSAYRELLAARTMDGLLDEIEAAQRDDPA